MIWSMTNIDAFVNSLVTKRNAGRDAGACMRLYETGNADKDVGAPAYLITVSRSAVLKWILSRLNSLPWNDIQLV